MSEWVQVGRDQYMLRIPEAESSDSATLRRKFYAYSQAGIVWELGHRGLFVDGLREFEAADADEAKMRAGILLRERLRTMLDSVP